MQRKKMFLMLVVTGALIVTVSGIALGLTQPAHAQCGSQASSCKNCHEVQAQHAVNNDGTAWHTSHAFGDFCYICHGGNQQATDKTAAHTGMVDPLSDIKASCASCHPNDLQARVQVYAAKLGVTLGAAPAASGPRNTASATPAAAAASNTSATPQPAAVAPQSTLAPNDPDSVNYAELYNESHYQGLIGKAPTNWGNVILLVMIGALLVGGGALVVTHEGWIKLSLGELDSIKGEYPADVVEMVTTIAKLKPNARKSLRRLLEKQDATVELLAFLDKLTEEKSSGQKE